MWNKIKDSKGVYIVVSILCAIILWMYVDTVVRPDAQVTIHNKKVTLIGEDQLEEESLMVAGDGDLTVNLTLTGNRAVISRLNKGNITVQADVASQVNEAGEAELDYSVIFPSNLNTSSVKVKARSPEKINVTVLKTARKTVAVQGEFSGSVADGYLRDANAFQFSTDKITVEGEESLVDSIDHAVVTLDRDNLKETWTGTLPITLLDENGESIPTESLILSEDEVDVTFRVNAVKEIPLTVNLKEGGGATKEDVTCTISPETITVSGTKDVLDELTEINLGTIDLAQVITSEKENFTIAMPEGVTNVSGTNSASVKVKINKELTTKKFDVTNIELKNVPEGYTATTVTKSVTVRIRGEEDSMALVVPDDVSIVADLSQVEKDTTGTCAVNAIVKVKGFSDVGVIGTYEVTVYIS